jgi:very-short-patch-repair endonuclease
MSTPSILRSLPTGPLTVAQARALGITADVLRGPFYRRLFRGVYLAVHVELTFRVWLQAVLLVVPADAVFSHLTALRIYGFAAREDGAFHVSTRTTTHSRHAGVTTHRRLARIPQRRCSGVPVTDPDRTIVDVATKVSWVELIQAAEFMIYEGLTTLDGLVEFAISQHLDGVLRTRRALVLIREGVESPMETLVRLMIVFARLPEPECNVNIRDAMGRFVARGDLVYTDLRVVVEYDGWYHERTAEQRRRDITRRERLEAAGWRVIVITSGDLEDKREIVHRVHRALIQRGYVGRAPILNTMWDTWFA